MYPGHHKIYNTAAVKNLIKPVAIPFHSLGVGSSEMLQPIGIETPYPKHIMDNAKTPDINMSSHEKVQLDGYSKPLTSEDFPTDLSYGNPLGGL